MKRNIILAVIIIAELIAIVYVHTNNYSINENYIIEKDLATLESALPTCIFSPFDSSVIECIDKEDDSIWPTFKCGFLNGNESIRMYLEPGYSESFDGCSYRLPKVTNVTINSIGFRDFEPSINKNNGTIRIIALGTSNTFGWGVELNQSWPKVLERKLNEDKSTKYEVINLGLPTSNFIEEVDFFIKNGIQYNPDLIIMEYNGFQAFLNYSIMKENYDNLLENREELQKSIGSSLDLNTLNEDEILTEVETIVYTLEVRKSSTELEDRLEKFIINPLKKIRSETNANIIFFNFIGEGNFESVVSDLDNIIENLDIINVRRELVLYPQEDLVLRSLDYHPSAKAYEITANILKENIN